MFCCTYPFLLLHLPFKYRIPRTAQKDSYCLSIPAFATTARPQPKQTTSNNKQPIVRAVGIFLIILFNLQFPINNQASERRTNNVLEWPSLLRSWPSNNEQVYDRNQPTICQANSQQKTGLTSYHHHRSANSLAVPSLQLVRLR